MSFNKWRSHVRCFSESAVSPPTLQEVSHVLGPGKVNKLQENKAITMKAFEVQPHVSFLFLFFQILRLVKVSASACCVIVSVAARWLDIPAHQPVRGHLHHKRAEPPLEVWGGDRGKHRERCGGIQEHQAAAGEPSLPFIKHTAALSEQFSQTKLANAAHVDNSRGHFFWSPLNCHLKTLTAIFWSLFFSFKKKRTLQ